MPMLSFTACVCTMPMICPPMHDLSCAIVEGPELVCMATLTDIIRDQGKDSIGDKVVASQDQWNAVKKWLEEVCDEHRPEKCLQSFLEAKVAGLQVVPVKCPRCSKPHSDHGKFAATEHQTHRCSWCGHEFKLAYGCVGNPVAQLHPVISEGRIFFHSFANGPDCAREADDPPARPWRGERR